MTTIEYDRLLIGGSWQAPASSERIQVYSASAEELVGSVPQGTEADVDLAVASARQAFSDPDGWRTWTPARRGVVLRDFAAALENRGPETARRVSLQNGMPLRLSSVIEATAPAMLLRYYADLVENRSEDRRQGVFGRQSILQRGPMGVVAAIVPWNLPQGLAFLKLAPALAAGCTVVLKPAPETVLDAFLMAEAAVDAGLPPGVLSVIPAGREVGAYLVEHPGVDKVSFTGSTAAGRRVAEVCGRMLRPVTLELGGKSAAILLDDVDFEQVADQFFGATMANSGQTCWLSTRVLIPRSRYESMVDSVADLVGSLHVGDPFDDATQVGPLVSAGQRARVESYIDKGMADGARVIVGGGRPGGLERGWFVEPTVFADVDPRTTIAREEIFGPVLAVIPYDDEDDAVAIANDSEYGLGGSVWSADPSRALDVASRVETGTVGINGYFPDPAIPMAGIKASGLGGGEMGPEAIHNYENVKSIYLDELNPTQP